MPFKYNFLTIRNRTNNFKYMEQLDFECSIKIKIFELQIELF